MIWVRPLAIKVVTSWLIIPIIRFVATVITSVAWAILASTGPFVAAVGWPGGDIFIRTHYPYRNCKVASWSETSFIIDRRLYS